MTVTVHYRDAQGRTQQASTTASRGDAAQVAIPGEDVRFPDIAYWLEASVATRPQGVGAGECRLPAAGCGTVTTPSPQADAVTVPVDNVIRATFRYPDGRPAKGVRVEAHPARDGRVWTAVTDDEGRIALTVPRNDPWVQQHQADGRFGDVFLSAVDAAPDQAPSPGQPQPVAGYRGESAAVVNFGDPQLAAAPAPQDQTVELWSTDVTFVNQADVEFCDSIGTFAAVCAEHVERERDVAMPAAINVGGGDDITSEFLYGHSKYTRSTFLVQAGADGTWMESAAEVGHMKEEAQGTFAGIGPIGPNDNRQMMVTWTWVKTRYTTCYGALVFASCREEHKWQPESWDTGYHDDTIPDVNHHDQASKQFDAPGSDCVARMDTGDKGVWSNVAKGSRRSYDISVAGGKTLQARTSYSQEDGQRDHVRHHWKVVDNPEHSYFHRYVPDGIVDPDAPPEVNKCPETHPALTWTDAADCNKTYDPESVFERRPVAPAWE